MTPKEAYAVFVMMDPLDPLKFAYAVAKERTHPYPAELRKHAIEYITDPKGFLNSIE